MPIFNECPSGRIVDTMLKTNQLGRLELLTSIILKNAGTQHYSYDNNGSRISGDGNTINHNVFNKPVVTIAEAGVRKYQVRTLKGKEVSTDWPPADATASKSEIKRALER